jgi:hypothetical protein
MDFGLPISKLSVLKGQIGEKVAESYINHVTIRNLKSTGGYGTAIYWPTSRLNLIEASPYITRRETLVRPFLLNKVLPTSELLARFDSIVQTLNTMPDGFLLKANRTSKIMSLRKGLNQLGLPLHIPIASPYMRTPEDSGDQLKFSTQMPEVDGDVEFVEVKTDSGGFRAKQVKAYTKALKRGFHLRVVVVRLVSFENNRFDVAESLVTSPD